MARFSLGMTALLTDPSDERPFGLYRDELLFTPIDCGRMTVEYELREVLNADLPMASGSEDDKDDLVVIARWEVGGFNTGGPMRPETAEHLLDRWRRVPQTASIDATLAELGLPGQALLLPSPYTPARIAEDRRVLPGLHLLPVRPVIAALADRPDAADALAILRLCAVHRFVVAATIGDN